MADTGSVANMVVADRPLAPDSGTRVVGPIRSRFHWRVCATVTRGSDHYTERFRQSRVWGRQRARTRLARAAYLRLVPIRLSQATTIPVVFAWENAVSGA
jgi:hypothetical protein